MLRPKKFRPFEKRILWGIAWLLMGGGMVGVVLAIERANWLMLIASVGVLALGVIYLLAAQRGKAL